jgi:hypothetical protein
MKKGKPRKEDSSLVIRDSKLEPFVIYYDGMCFSVMEETNNNDKVVGYYSRMSGAIHSVVKQKMLGTREYTLDEFVDSYQEKLDDFTDIFDKFIK